MKCTWKGCKNKGSVVQLDRNGEMWAKLCEEHNKQLKEAIDLGDPKTILKCWIKASGGAEKLTKTITNKGRI